MAAKRAAVELRPLRLGFQKATVPCSRLGSLPGHDGFNHVFTSRARIVTLQPGSTSATPVGFLRRTYASSTESQSLGKTALYDLHVEHGGKMVPFGGFHMPVQYKDLSISDSHRWTREKASLFDVSHMVQHNLSGPGAAAFISRVTPSSPDSLKPNHGSLSCLLHPNTGGIVDDTVITKLSDGLFYFVTNAACRDKDLEYLKTELEAFKKEHPEKPVEWKLLDERGLVAVQGPLAEEILTAVLADKSEDGLKQLYFGQCKYVAVETSNGGTIRVLASRGGYTGEDGFELSTPDAASTIELTETLMQSAGQDKLRLAGLGARDSLRLEAGMCLYGHDLDDSTTPVEGALAWVVGKDRRAEGGFHGADTILAQLKPKSKGGKGVERRRVGLIVEGAPAREGAEIVDDQGNAVGKVTSGCPSPTTGKNIAMGYVKDGLHKAGTELNAVVRGKKRKAVVTKMPFVDAKYYKQALSPA